MTISGIMQGLCRSILADDPAKEELTRQDVKNVQAHIQSETGIFVDDRDIKIFYSSFAAQYWRMHTKPPLKRKDLPKLQHAN